MHASLDYCDAIVLQLHHEQTPDSEMQLVAAIRGAIRLRVPSRAICASSGH